MEDILVVGLQCSLAVGEVPLLAGILGEEQHLVDILVEELHKEVGSNLAEDKQVPGQETLAVLVGYHMHKGCIHLA